MAWMGDPRGEDYGSFCLIQLYHIRDAGTHDSPLTFYPHWVESKDLAGPIYNRNGGTSLDYDPLFRIPVLKARLADFGITHRQVFSGEFLNKVKDWLVPLGRRLSEDAREKNRQLKSAREDITNEMTEFLWKEANKTGATAPIVAKEFCRDEMKKFNETAEKKAAELDTYFNHVGMK
jgi:hypothetical protein